MLVLFVDKQKRKYLEEASQDNIDVKNRFKNCLKIENQLNVSTFKNWYLSKLFFNTC